MASNTKKYKYESFWSPWPPGIHPKEMSAAFNRANSRFWHEAKRRGDESPALYSQRQRENGMAMVETMSELAYKWQQIEPGWLPCENEQFLSHMSDFFNIKFPPSYFNYQPSGGASRGGVGPGQLYHRLYDWVVLEEEEAEEDEDEAAENEGEGEEEEEEEEKEKDGGEGEEYEEEEEE